MCILDEVAASVMLYACLQCTFLVHTSSCLQASRARVSRGSKWSKACRHPTVSSRIVHMYRMGTSSYCFLAETNLRLKLWIKIAEVVLVVSTCITTSAVETVPRKDRAGVRRSHTAQKSLTIYTDFSVTVVRLLGWQIRLWMPLQKQLSTLGWGY